MPQLLPYQHYLSGGQPRPVRKAMVVRDLSHKPVSNFFCRGTGVDSRPSLVLPEIRSKGSSPMREPKANIASRMKALVLIKRTNDHAFRYSKPSADLKLDMIQGKHRPAFVLSKAESLSNTPAMVDC
jgi:hypothetical protein